MTLTQLFKRSSKGLADRDRALFEELDQVAAEFPRLLEAANITVRQLLNRPGASEDAHRLLLLTHLTYSSHAGDVDYDRPLKAVGHLGWLQMHLEVLLSSAAVGESGVELVALRQLAEQTRRLQHLLVGATEAVQRVASQGDEQRMRWRRLVAYLVSGYQGTVDDSDTPRLPDELQAIRALLHEALED